MKIGYRVKAMMPNTQGEINIMAIQNSRRSDRLGENGEPAVIPASLAFDAGHRNTLYKILLH